MKASMAVRMLSKKGIAFAKLYLDRSEADAAGAKLCACEYGHLDCAHIKGGACRDELAGLIESFSKNRAKLKEAAMLAGELMAYGVSPEEAMA